MTRPNGRVSASLIATALAVTALVVALTRNPSQSSAVTETTTTVTSASESERAPRGLDAYLDYLAAFRGVRVRLQAARNVVRSGALLPVTVTVTNTSTRELRVGVCLSTFDVYPSFIETRTGRSLTGPDPRDAGCITIGVGIAPGHARSYSAHARAVTGIPLTLRERGLPPGVYRLALRPFTNVPPHLGLDHVPPLTITVVA
jgi:hypothetical protein